MNTIQKISRKFAEHNKVPRCPWPEYNSSADGNWIRSSSGLPWLKLDIEIPFEKIFLEIQNIKIYFSDHRTDYNEHSSWRSFCIHGKSYDSTREDEYYKDSRPYGWTPESEQMMPETVAFFKTQWPSQDFLRLRIMELAPGGIISVHTDGEGIGKLYPINIAITQPSGCDFYMEKFGIVPFSKGDSYILNVHNRHTIINNSNEYRYHVIIHHKNIDELDQLILKSYKKSYEM